MRFGAVLAYRSAHSGPGSAVLAQFPQRRREIDTTIAHPEIDDVPAEIFAVGLSLVEAHPEVLVHREGRVTIRRVKRTTPPTFVVQIWVVS